MWLVRMAVGCLVAIAAATAGAGEPPPAATQAAGQTITLEANDIPLADMVKLVAKKGHLNILVDPALTALGEQSPLARPVQVELKDVTAQAAVVQLVGKQHLKVTWDNETRTGRISAESAKTAGRSEPLPKAAASTNLIAELAVEDVPLLEAITSLIRETGMNVMVDAWVAGSAAGADGQIKQWPKADFHLEGLTGIEALGAVLENWGLALVWNPRAGVARVTSQDRRGWELAHPLNDPLPLVRASQSTNAQPLVFIDEAPVGEVIQLLCDQAGLNVLIEPRLAAGWRAVAEGKPVPRELAGIPTSGRAKLRNVSTYQALLAFLDWGGLTLVSDEETGIDRIMTKETRWEQKRVGGPNPSPLPLSVGVRDSTAPIALQGESFEDACSSLARLAHVNLLVEPRMHPGLAAGAQDPNLVPEVSLELKGVSPTAALLAVAANYGFAIVWDPATLVARAVPQEFMAQERAKNAASAVLVGQLPAQPASTAAFIFEDTPLVDALKTLSDQAKAKLDLDPRLGSAAAAPDSSGKSPNVRVRLEKISPAQALAALVATYDLEAVWDAPSRAVKIRPK